MKPDTERTKRYFAPLHKRKDFLHAHVSKDLRQKMNPRSRAVLLHKGDKVRVLRGVARGKEARVLRVDYNKLKVYVEGISSRTARGREVPCALEPSNLMIIEISPKSPAAVMKPEIQNAKPKTQNTKPETGGGLPETGDRKQETRGPKPEARNPEPETGNRMQAAGGGVQPAGPSEPKIKGDS